jgi:signal transduction histidine kinase
MANSVNELLFNSKTNESQEERSKQEIKIEYLLREGFNRDNLEMKSDLNPRLIKALAKAKMHSSIFADTLIAMLCSEVMVLNISKERKGRKELTDLAKMLATDQDQEGQGVLSRLMGN